MPISPLRKAAARALYFSGAFSVAPYLQTPWKILMYHRVIEPEQLPYQIESGMYVRPRTFEMQMKLLKRSCRVVPLGELLSDILSKKKIPHKTVAITFDDGWSDNFIHALPVLHDLSLPASLFLPTGFIDSSDLFWTDAISVSLTGLYDERSRTDLIRSLRNRLPDDVANSIQTIMNEWAADKFESHRTTEALESLLRFLFEMPRESRQPALECFYAQIPVELLSALPRPFLTWEEVLEMRSKGFTIGAHSHGHERFAELSRDEIDRDLSLCRHLLKEKLSETLPILCYPGGSWSRNSQELALKHGFQATLGVRRSSLLGEHPPLLGRIGIHEDISATAALFSLRLWGR